MFESIFADRRRTVMLIVMTLATFGFVVIFTPLLVPLALAVIFSFGISEIFNQLHRRFEKKQVRWVLYGIGVFLTGFFLILSVNSVSRLYTLTVGEEKDKTLHFAKSAIEKIDTTIDDVTANYGQETIGFGSVNKSQIKTQVKDIGRTYVNKAFAAIGLFFASLPSLGADLFVMLVALFVMLSHRGKIYAGLIKANLFYQADLKEVTKIAQEVSYTVIITNLFVGMVQASIISFGAWLVGLNEWSIIFLMSFVSSFLPVVGTTPAALSLALLSFAMGNTSGGFWMLFVTFLAGTIDNFLRPYLVSRSEKNVNSIVSLIGIIGAIMVFGFGGLFIGPFLVAFVCRVWPYFMNSQPHVGKNDELQKEPGKVLAH